VYVDGEVRGGDGVMGTLVIPVSPGVHRLEVVKPGFGQFSSELKLQERQRHELRVRLDPKAAT
jgi:hypothetical protein